MLTPVELQNIPLKAGMGYRKKDVDDLLDEICKDYEYLYKENVELKDKLAILSDGLQYYKEMEKTLQKTLVVAEKTAEEMQTTSQAKADLLKQQAKIEAAAIIEEAKNQVQKIHTQTLALVQQYEAYRIQYKRLAAAQMELLENETYQLDFNMQMPEFSSEIEKELKASENFDNHFDRTEPTEEREEKKESISIKLEKEEDNNYKINEAKTNDDDIDLEKNFTVNIEDSF